MHMAMEIVESPDAAQDVVQEAAARVWAGLDECRDPEKLESVILSAVKNLALNVKRDESRRSDLLRGNPDPPPRNLHGITPDEYTELEEVRRRLVEGFWQLPDRFRRPLLLRVHGVPPAEIAERTGLEKQVVYNYVAEARATLASCLKNRTHG